MPKVNLADIKAAAEKKYGPLIIKLAEGEVTLTNALRLPKAKRTKLAGLNANNDLEVDDKLAEIIRIACSPSDAKRLLAEIGDDLPTLAQIVKDWTASTQVGEASPSAS